MLGRLGQFDGVAANAIILPLWFGRSLQRKVSSSAMFIESLLLIYLTDTESSTISTNFDWPKSVTKLANISGLTVPN